MLHVNCEAKYFVGILTTNSSRPDTLLTDNTIVNYSAYMYIILVCHLLTIT